MKDKRNSVFALFNNVSIAKFPDNDFVKDEKYKNLYLKYDWCFNEKKLVCNLFDKVEKHVNADNFIIRVILTRTSIEEIKIVDLELLVNRLCQIEHPDKDCSKSFSDNDKIDFLNKRNWKRYWFSLESHKIHVHIYRESELFALHIVFH